MWFLDQKLLVGPLNVLEWSILGLGTSRSSPFDGGGGQRAFLWKATENLKQVEFLALIFPLEREGHLKDLVRKPH